MSKILIIIVALSLPALAGAQPSIEFDAETHDFGKIMQGDLLEYSFLFRNSGTEDLIIKGVATS